MCKMKNVITRVIVAKVKELQLHVQGIGGDNAKLFVIASQLDQMS